MATFSGKNVRLAIRNELVKRKERLKVTWPFLVEKGIEHLENEKRTAKVSDSVEAA